MGDIEHQQNRIRTRHAIHLAAQHIHGDALVVGIGGQAVHTRQIDDPDLASAARQQTHTLLHRHSRIVSDLLAKARQAIEES